MFDTFKIRLMTANEVSISNLETSRENLIRRVSCCVDRVKLVVSVISSWISQSLSYGSNLIHVVFFKLRKKKVFFGLHFNYFMRLVVKNL